MQEKSVQPAMDSAIKRIPKYWIFIALIALVILVRVVYLESTKKERLVMTPSTHEEIVFFDIESAQSTKEFKVFFCLYDEACDCIQICIKAPKDALPFLQRPRELELYVNDEKISEFCTAGQEGSYGSILLYDITDTITNNADGIQSVRCVYGDASFEAVMPD